MTEQELANVIWDIKEIIRNLYDDAEVEDVILPFTLLRRLDCVLDSKRDAIMNETKDLPDAQKKFKLKALMRQNGLSFFNTSGLSLEKLLGAKAEERWGAGVVEQVSLDLQKEFPNVDGFSASNLWRIKQWFLFYTSEPEKLAQGVRDIIQRPVGEFPKPFALVPWGQY